MALNILSICALLGFMSGVLGSSCSSPEVQTKYFSTQDATIVSNIAYVAEFSVKCKSGTISNLYADIDGNIVPIPMVGGEDYQVSWTEDTKTARSGERKVRLFDEDGYNAVRKALRSGEDIGSVAPIFEVAVVHPGAFNGPWLKSELLATILSFVVAYIAISQRNKLLS